MNDSSNSHEIAPRQRTDVARLNSSIAIVSKLLAPSKTSEALQEAAGLAEEQANLYYKQGQYASAEPLYKRALAIREKALGPDHPSVATGAALFASTKALPTDLQGRNLDNVQLKLTYPDTTVEEKEKIGLRVLRKDTEGEVPAELVVEVNRSDGAWSSGRCNIDDDVCIVPVLLATGASNAFSLALYDDKGTEIPCEPSTFSIMQGLKVADATLPFHIGVEAYEAATGKTVFHTISGLEKNQSLPAKGRVAFRTQKQIRPGRPEDRIKFPIYEGQYGAQGTRAVYNPHIYDIVITGDDLPRLLPEDSEVEVVLDVDASMRITFSAYFPYIDETIEFKVALSTDEEVDAKWGMREVDVALQTLALLPGESGTATIEKLQDDLKTIAEMFEKGDRDTKYQARDRLWEVLKTLDSLQEASELPKVRAELEAGLEQLEEVQKRYGSKSDGRRGSPT